MMAYKPTLKLYAADGTTLDTSFFPAGVIPQSDQAPSPSWSVYGGCVAMRFMIQLPDAVRFPFVVSRGQVVKLFQFDDDTDPSWSGIIDTVSREMGSAYHVVECRSWWDQLEAAEIATDIEVGAQATGTITVGSSTFGANTFDTVGKIVNLLLDKYIVPAGVGITYDAGDISSNVPRALMRFRTGTPIKRALAELSLAAESINIGTDGLKVATPTRYAYGVDALGHFFFKPIPTTITATLAFGAAIIEGGTEKPQARPAQEVRVIGQVSPASGVKAKRTYRYPSLAGRIRSRTIRVTGTHYESDMARVAAGWQSRYSDPAPTIEGAITVQGTPVAVPMPWAGLIRWRDPARDLDVDSYVASITATMGTTFAYTAELGIGIEAGPAASDDPFSPSPYDDVIGGTEGGLPADDIDDWPECSDTDPDYPVDYPGVDPPEDYPHESGGDVPITIPDGTITEDMLDTDLQDKLNGIPEGGTVIPLGEVIDYSARDVSLGQNKKFIVQSLVIGNGNSATAFTPEVCGSSTPVLVYYRYVDKAGALVASGNFALTNTGTNGTLDYWAANVNPTDDNGYLPDREGRIHFSFRVQTATDTYLWIPTNIGTGDNWKICPHALVIDRPTSTQLQQVTVTGWPI